MKRGILYILAVLLLVGGMAGCDRQRANQPGEEQNELLDPVPTPLPEVTALPDVNDGIVEDDDGILEDGDTAGEEPETSPSSSPNMK